MDNDIHFMRKELDNLQRKVKGFDVLTEYALSESDTIAPTGEWSMDKPSFTDDGFIWVRNTFKTGYGDIVLEPYCIGDGQEHILSLTMEYAVSNDPFTAPTGSWVDVAPTLSTGQYLWTRTVIVTNYGSTTTSPVRLTGEKGITGDAISIKGDTGDEGKGYDFIYYTSQYDTAPTTPASDVVRTENVYEAWCDYPCSVTDTYKYTYMSMRTSDNGVWSNWSTPTLMSSIGEKGEDGEGYEIIFCQTKTNVPPTFQNGENLHTFNGTVNGKHFNDNDFVPTNWSDDSNGVNSTFKYEYASTRTKTNGVWSDFSSPALWNIYSESTYTHIRYSAVNNPSSISQTTTTPNSNTQYIGIYVDKKESETFSSYSWKKWIPKEGVDYDGRFLHIKYSNDEGTTMIDTGGSYIGICYSYTDTAPTDPNAYTWSRIRGSDGTGMDFAYYSCANENNELSAPTTVRTGTPQANNWYERPYGVSEQIQYCYVSTKPTGGSSWGTPVLWAKYGATGQKGGAGERGEDGIGLEQIFCRTDKDGYIVDNTGTRLTINGAVRKLASYSNAQPHTWSAVTTDDYFDETKGWYDNPVGVTENCPYEYVAQRMKTVTNKTNPNQANYKVAVWGKFNVYSQWSNYSEDGVSITGTTVYYAQTTDYTNAPTSPSAWREGTPQTYEAGKFYWVKQVIHYDNGTSDETAPLCVSGVDGQSVHFVYYCGNTVPTKPNSSDNVVANGSTSSDYRKWVEDPVSVTSTNPYLFMSQSTDYNYSTGKWTNFSTPAQISTYSTDGTTVKTEWRYLTKADTSTPSTSYGGWSATPVAVTEDKPYCFITSRIVTGNSNGAWTTPVLWSRYANDGDRGTGIFTLTSYTESSASITGNPNVKYKISKSTIQDQIGSITLLVGDQLRTGYYIYPVLSSDNTYYYLGEKSNIRGESGASIDSVVNYYLASANSSGVTHSTTGWTTDVTHSNAKLSASKPYLWNYEDTFDSDGARVNRTNPVVIGKFGKEISGVTEFYQVSSSDSSVPSSWVTPADNNFVMPVTDNTNRFLWNYERVNYSDGSYDETEKRIIGTYGEKGDDGVDGDKFYEISTQPPTYSNASYPERKYRLNLYNINVQDINGVDLSDIKAGDVFKYSTYLYPILEVWHQNSSNWWVYFGEKTELKGDKGDDGEDGVNGEGEQFIYFISDSNDTLPDTPVEDIQIVTNSTKHIGITNTPTSGTWNYNNKTYSFRKSISSIRTESNDAEYSPTVGDILVLETRFFYLDYFGSSNVYLIEIPNIWYSSPQEIEVGYQYQYVSSRNFDSSTETWGSWATPSLWNRYAKDGEKGDIGGKGRDGRDGTELTAEQIMEKIRTQTIDAQSVGGIKPDTILTNEVTSMDIPEGSSTTGKIYIRKQGNICSVTLANFQFKVLAQQNYTANVVAQLPSWAKPLTIQYGQSVPTFQDNRVRIREGGQIETFTSSNVGDTILLTCSFTYLTNQSDGLTTTLSFDNATNNNGTYSQSIVTGNEIIATLKYTDTDNSQKILVSEPVQFIINGQSYGRTTDPTGKARINLNLLPSTYTINVNYNGNSKYNSSNATNNITITKANNPVITFHPSLCKALISNNGTPLRGLNVIINANNEANYNTMTGSDGYVDFTDIVNNYYGNVNIQIITNDLQKCKLVSDNSTYASSKVFTETKVVASPYKIEQNGSGVNWKNLNNPSTLTSPNDGSYVQTYSINNGSVFKNLKMTCHFDIPTNARVTNMYFRVRYASLLGQVSSSKGSYVAPVFTLWNLKNQLGGGVTPAGAVPIYRTDCGRWYDVAWSTGVVAEYQSNSDGEWNEFSVQLQSMANTGGKESANSSGYGNNSSFGVDYLIVELTYDMI